MNRFRSTPHFWSGGTARTDKKDAGPVAAAGDIEGRVRDACSAVARVNPCVAVSDFRGDVGGQCGGEQHTDHDKHNDDLFIHTSTSS